jgi:thioredoxin-related protein
VVDGLQRSERAPVVRLSVTDSVGGQLAREYGVRGVPTLLLLDRDGRAVHRQVGRLNASSLYEALDALQITQTDR